LKRLEEALFQYGLGKALKRFLPVYRFQKLIDSSVGRVSRLCGRLRVDFFGRFRQRLRHFNWF
jgi:hypothetical protein